MPLATRFVDVYSFLLALKISKYWCLFGCEEQRNKSLVEWSFVVVLLLLGFAQMKGEATQ